MSETEKPIGVAWEPFFLTHALPRAEEEAFRGYLVAAQVPHEAGLQELTAHYGEFRKRWGPEQQSRI